MEEVREIVTELANKPGFQLDSVIKNKTRFAFLEWDRPALLTAEGQVLSGRNLLFEFWYYPDRVGLHLFIVGGSEATRERLFNIVDKHSELFKVTGSWGQWSRVFNRTFLDDEEMNRDIQELNSRIRKQWADFLENDLPRIDAALKQERWIWESSETDEPSED